MKHPARHHLYRTWIGLMVRCYTTNRDAYKDYGGRGITVCDRWRNSFDDFVADMGPRPPGHSIDRKDVNGHYEPDNCRWATPKEQARNKRNTQTFTHEGITYKVADLAEQHGLPWRTVSERVKRGCSMEEILSKERFYNNKESQAKAVAASQAKKRTITHCPHGHEYTEENTYTWKNMRSCKACKRAYDKYLYYGKTRSFTDFL